MTCPKIKIRLNPSHIKKNKNVIIEKGIKILNRDFSRFFKSNSPPREPKTNPNSNG